MKARSGVVRLATPTPVLGGKERSLRIPDGAEAPVSATPVRRRGRDQDDGSCGGVDMQSLRPCRHSRSRCAGTAIVSLARQHGDCLPVSSSSPHPEALLDQLLAQTARRPSTRGPERRNGSSAGRWRCARDGPEGHDRGTITIETGPAGLKIVRDRQQRSICGNYHRRIRGSFSSAASPMRYLMRSPPGGQGRSSLAIRGLNVSVFEQRLSGSLERLRGQQRATPKSNDMTAPPMPGWC
jgi:hypothetical protein